LSRPLDPAFWDARYSEPESAYGLLPNRFLLESHGHIEQGGRVLLPGDGEGRNGVWLARHGYKVTSVDMSAAGCAKARQLAIDLHTDLEIIHADLRHWDWPVGAFEAVALIFVHVASDVRSELLQRLRNAVVPGGVVLCELFAPGHLAYRRRDPAAGGPAALSMLVSGDELRRAFAGFAKIHAVEMEVELDEGRYHRGKALVTRAIYRSPAP
jgi:SAM-dependent methyltransferase